MASPDEKLIAKYFKEGAKVELSSNDKGFLNSWYEGTVIRLPVTEKKSKPKFLVEYKTLVDEDEEGPLREEMELMQLRPPLPPENRRRFNVCDDVDAFYHDGWWEGIITEIRDDDKYVVFFRGTRERKAFKAARLRIHREWVRGKWFPPVKEGDKVNEKVVSSAEQGSNEEFVEHTLDGEQMDYTPIKELSEDTPTKKHTGHTPTKERTEHDPTKVRTEHNPTNEPIEHTPTNELSKDTPTNHLSEDTPPDQLSRDTPTNQLSEDTPTKELTGHTITKEPTKHTSNKKRTGHTPNKEHIKHTAKRKRIEHTPNKKCPGHAPNKECNGHTPNIERNTHTSNKERSTRTSNMERNTRTFNKEQNARTSNMERNRRSLNKERNGHTPSKERTEHTPNEKHSKHVPDEEQIEVTFHPGEQVEVCSDEDGFEGAWFPAAIIEKLEADKYLIEYQSINDDNDNSKLRREEINSLHIRPCPQEIPVVDRFDTMEEVDAFHKDLWWAGVITRVLHNEKYKVYFRASDEEMKFDHSDLRVHQDWINGKWVIPQKDMKL